ncbi:FecR family protein [Flavivirga eckloniae]|uniref:Anti-sigma factor n=1 Tax=Flavivirga eckloniae TaxID=1803846 RepID=A0A2K9PLU7_9FLAO|nr:FecR family protein [Flavivirga eckloniae]AUP78041.1 anti-sigma factor [Flavivirga eckloniae]
MNNSDKIKSLSEKIVASLLKGEAPIDLEEFNELTEDDKEYILSSIKNKSKREERLELRKKINKQKAWETIIGKEKQSYFKPKTFWYRAIAASIVILIGIVFLLNKNEGLQIDTVVTAENNIKIGTDQAILTLDDGSEVYLEKGQVYQSGNVNSNGEEIIYLADHLETRTKDIAYNILTVPRGGQFQIKLSDGTKIWLNSESQLKYPVTFNGMENRRVELIYGEAYLDVSPSTLHQGAKFNVYNQYQEVEVLGTEFNIKAYKDETNIYTTLVEGKVLVKTNTYTSLVEDKVLVDFQDKKQHLVPGQQLNLDIQNNNLSVTTVDNTYKDISWKKGKFSFRKKTLKNIMKDLSRWYDMKVIFENKETEDKVFTGSFKKSFSIEEVMTFIKHSNSINDYYIKDKTLTIIR